jgi:hypothetical protein
MRTKAKECENVLKLLKIEISKYIKKYNIKIKRHRYKTRRGKTYPKKYIKIPCIKCIYTAYIALHEIGHVKLNHTIITNKPKFQKEYEAEKFALNCLKRNKINKLYPNIYNKISNKAILYIMFHIQNDKNRNKIQKGSIKKEVYEFCKLDKFYHLL